MPNKQKAHRVVRWAFSFFENGMSKNYYCPETRLHFHQMTASIPIYQLKISLVGGKPPIWRRVLVFSAIKLSKLHFVIQGIFDWDNSHLHSFTHAGIEYALPMKADYNFGLDFDSKDERKAEAGVPL